MALDTADLGGDQSVDEKLVEKRFTPGSLRPSAVTADYLLNGSLARLQWRGRWSTYAVVRHYIQLGTYHLAAVSTSTRTKRRLYEYAAVWEKFVEQCTSHLERL